MASVRLRSFATPVQRRTVADYQQPQLPRIQPGFQPPGSLDDDLRPDAGRIAHGDAEARGGHNTPATASA